MINGYKIVSYLFAITFALNCIPYFRIPGIELPLPYLFLLMLSVLNLAVFKVFKRESIVSFFMMMLISALLFLYGAFSASTNFSFSDFIKFSIAAFCSFGISIVVEKIDQRKFIFLLAMFSSILIAIYIYHYLIELNSPFLSVAWDEITEAGKNQMALYLTVIFPIVFWGIVFERGIFRFLYLLFTVVHVVAIVYCLSRSAWLVSLISFLLITIVFLKKYKEKKYKYSYMKILVLGVMVSTIALIYIVKFTDYGIVLIERFDSLVSLQDYGGRSSIGNREKYNELSVEYFDNNILGYGSNYFLDRNGYMSHNSYTQLLVDYGILSFTAFMLWLIFSFINGWFALDNKYSIAYFHASLCAFLYMFFINAFSSLIVIFPILAMCHSRINKNEK